MPNNKRNSKEDENYEEIFANEESEEDSSDSDELGTDDEEEEDEDIEEKLKWNNGSFTAKQWKFNDKKNGPAPALVNSKKVSSPVDYFYKFIDLNLTKIIVNETKNYFKQSEEKKKITKKNLLLLHLQLMRCLH